MAKAKRAAKKPRRYSDDDRANALAALAANGGNVDRTGRELGIPAATLRKWAKGQRHPEAVQMAEGKKPLLADRLEEVAWKMADAIPDKLANTPLAQLAVSLGIVIDKMRLLRNEPTQINRTEGGDDPRGLTDEELERRIESARGRAAVARPGPGGAGAGAPGGGAGPAGGGEGA